MVSCGRIIDKHNGEMSASYLESFVGMGEELLVESCPFATHQHWLGHRESPPGYVPIVVLGGDEWLQNVKPRECKASLKKPTG